MQSEWNIVKLGEVVNFNTGKLDSNQAEDNGVYPFFTCSPITLAINREAFDTEAVLLAGNNANGVFSVKYYKGKFNAYQRTYVVTPKDRNNISTKWLYFRIKHVTKELQQLSVGSATKFLTKKILDNFEIKLPSINTQDKIAKILWSLENKIELNRKMNQTLEEMAQALFKSWFVDFDPVHVKVNAAGREDALGCKADDVKSDEALESAAVELGISKEVLELFPSELEESEMGMIPKGWEVSTIEDEVTIYGGATPSTKEDRYWVDGENHWATPRDLSGLNSKVLIDTGRKITDDGVNKISSKQLPIGTVLLSSRAPVGYIAYSTVSISINQGFIAMVCKKRLSNYFIMYWLDIAMNEIKNRAIGTTFSEISKSAFRPIKLVVSSAEVITAFDAIVAPMVNKIIANEYEIETLEKTRDTLLPRLLSGELDVSEVEVT